MPKNSQARIDANARYNKKAYESIALRVHKGTRDRWRQAAEARGLSLAGLIVAAVEKYLSEQ